MSDDQSDNQANETQEGATGEQQEGRQRREPGLHHLQITAQYLKDFSFENPNAPATLVRQEQAPTIEVDVDANARGIAQDYYEAEVTIKASAKYEDKTAFLIELVYAGVANVSKVPEEQRSAAVLVEAPRLLFPFARQIVANATTQGGFPPLLLNPVDFLDVQRRKRQRQQEESGEGTSAGNGADTGSANSQQA